MELIVALLVGFFAGAGIYRLLSGGKMDIFIGLILLGQAANLTIFVGGGLRHNAPALLPKGETINPTDFSDPVPQALVLTAIVIGFGILAFLLTLLLRTEDK